jgi:hypothetical protein
MEISYKKCVNYLLPNLSLDDRKYENLNKYGLMRLDYLKKSKNGLYQSLLMQDKLHDHLLSVSKESEDKVNLLIKQLIELDGNINEKLKDKNEMLWVQKMNKCKSIVEELVIKENIYEEKI